MRRFLHEKRPVQYVLGSNNIWHWYKNCPEYPVSFLMKENEYDDEAPSGELCRHCLLIEFNNNLKELIRQK